MALLSSFLCQPRQLTPHQQSHKLCTHFFFNYRSGEHVTVHREKEENTEFNPRFIGISTSNNSFSTCLTCLPHVLSIVYSPLYIQGNHPCKIRCHEPDIRIISSTHTEGQVSQRQAPEIGYSTVMLWQPKQREFRVTEAWPK